MIRILLASCAIALSACAGGVRVTPSETTNAVGPKPTKLSGYLGKDALNGRVILAPPPGLTSQCK